MHLDSVSSWASDHYMLIEPSKTEGLVISLDPRGTEERQAKHNHFYNWRTQVPFKKHIKILGVNIDTQLTFTEHTNLMAKMGKRTQLLSSLSGKNWGLTTLMSGQEHCTPQ